MPTYPSISLAIPTFNEEANIERCLGSIVRQRYKGKLEIFVVDGGSTDRTLTLAKKYPVIILPNPYKQAEYGKKIALMHATSTYFMILDCDMDIRGNHWFEKMVRPLEDDPTIIGSWVKFVSDPNDAPLNRFITLDPIQRDPLFRYLTPSISSCVVSKARGYWVVKYSKNHMLPAGFNLYRRKQILGTVIADLKKFMELDNLVILLSAGYDRYAYVQSIGIHHPFLTTLENLARKRIRNLETMYFDQPNSRYWTWIDWQNPLDMVRIGLWILYCYTIVPSIIVGCMKSIRYRTFSAFYEAPFNLVATTAVIWSFLKQGMRRLR